MKRRSPLKRDPVNSPAPQVQGGKKSCPHTTAFAEEAIKRILIITAGSRGDVAPYTGLGRGLLDEGHQVSVAAHPPTKHSSKNADSASGLYRRRRCRAPRRQPPGEGATAGHRVTVGDAASLDGATPESGTGDVMADPPGPVVAANSVELSALGQTASGSVAAYW